MHPCIVWLSVPVGLGRGLQITAPGGGAELGDGLGAPGLVIW